MSIVGFVAVSLTISQLLVVFLTSPYEKSEIQQFQVQDDCDAVKLEVMPGFDFILTEHRLHFMIHSSPVRATSLKKLDRMHNFELLLMCWRKSR